MPINYIVDKIRNLDKNRVYDVEGAFLLDQEKKIDSIPLKDSLSNISINLQNYSEFNEETKFCHTHCRYIGL